jgi:hypothetical protein
MCAQGSSAGSAALAYATAWYGAADPTVGYLDKLELVSGPVFSDIAQGCYVPTPPATVPPVNICASNPNYCLGWQAGGLSESPSYVGGAQFAVQSWTGDSSCRGSRPTVQGSYNAWLAQSIVNGPNGGGGQFNYPKTSILAWLCASDVQGVNNNSAPEGWLFYKQVGSSGVSPLDFWVSAVNLCSDTEGVAQGTVAGSLYTGLDGFDAITQDMAGNSLTRACQKNAGH